MKILIHQHPDNTANQHEADCPYFAVVVQVKQHGQHRYANRVKGAAFTGGVVYRENGNIQKENYRRNHKGNNRRADAAQRFFNKARLAEFFQRAGNKINYNKRRQ